MKNKEAFERLEALDRKTNLIGHIDAVLGWDFETSMSARGGEERARQMAWLEGEIHKILTSSEMNDALSCLDENASGFSDRDRAIVRIARKAFNEEKNIPDRLVSEFAEASGAASDHWFEARRKGDFESYRPYLEKVFELVKEKAQCMSDGKSLYDTLLDRYEPRMDSKRIAELFDQMEGSIHKVMDMTSGKAVDDSFLYAKYPQKTQERFDKGIVRSMGFDFERGVIGISHHPFTTAVGADDIRITSRFTDPRVADPLFSYIHEAGHALYEMGASNKNTAGTCLASGTSMAFHESQSRLWENVIGHSESFWKYYFPKFRNAYKKQTEGVDFQHFMRALNKVQPSDIRVNADEVTYGLHIILRFRLEKALFDGTLKIADLPAAWDEMSLSLLGRKPENVSAGVLQDNHWASGMFGYFPSYALGNLINSQIYYTMKKDLDIDALLEAGKLKKIKSYLNDRIYKYGAIYESDVLLKRITGEALDEKYFDMYLTDKFSKLYC
ncbi:MAG: carboxypeptidase M32 [Sphaerochaetaceae bacterium]